MIIKNVVLWQAIYELCSGEENVVTDLKMIKEVKIVKKIMFSFSSNNAPN